MTLAATDAGSGVGEMRFNNEGGGWSAWVPYATSRAGWVLPAADGVKTVQAQFRDKVGNQSGVGLGHHRPRHGEAQDQGTARRSPCAGAAPRRSSTRSSTARRTEATATVIVRVKTLGGTTVKTLKLGVKPVNVTKTATFTCTLAAKTYKYFVYATDAAGNAQGVVGSNRLTVR